MAPPIGGWGLKGWAEQKQLSMVSREQERRQGGFSRGGGRERNMYLGTEVPVTPQAGTGVSGRRESKRHEGGSSAFSRGDNTRHTMSRQHAGPRPHTGVTHQW